MPLLHVSLPTTNPPHVRHTPRTLQTSLTPTPPTDNQHHPTLSPLPQRPPPPPPSSHPLSTLSVLSPPGRTHRYRTIGSLFPRVRNLCRTPPYLFLTLYHGLPDQLSAHGHGEVVETRIIGWFFLRPPLGCEGGSTSSRTDFFSGCNISLPHRAGLSHVCDFPRHTANGRVLRNAIPPICLAGRGPDGFPFSLKY